MKKQRGYQKRVIQLYILFSWVYKILPSSCTKGEVNVWSQTKKKIVRTGELYMTEESEDEEAGVVRKHHILWQSDGKF